MQPKTPGLLWEVADATRSILEWTADVTFETYIQDQLLRSAVERYVEIVGEAILRVERTDPATAGRISDYRAIIDLRNHLIYDYDTTDHAVVWEIVQEPLPVLKVEVEQLLQEVDDA